MVLKLLQSVDQGHLEHAFAEELVEFLIAHLARVLEATDAT